MLLYTFKCITGSLKLSGYTMIFHSKFYISYTSENVMGMTTNDLDCNSVLEFSTSFFPMLSNLCWSFKFYFSSYLQTDFSAYKPEYLTLPP